MPTVAEVAETLETLTSRDFRYRSRLFVEQFGSRPIEDLTVLDLIGYREKINKRYGQAWTGRDYLNAAKKILRWSASVGLRPPIDLSAVKDIKPKQRPKDTWSPEQVRKLLSIAKTSDHRVEAFMRLQYLAALRPSETLRLAAGEYERLSESVVCMEQSKTDLPRYVVLSDAAMIALLEAKQAKPKRKGRSKTSVPWAHCSAYGKAGYMATGHRPHRLRHSAATSLLRHGVSRQDVDLLLGHAVGNRISLTYMQVQAAEYERLLPAAERLAGDIRQ